MDYNSYIQEKLSKLIFLNIKNDVLQSIFKNVKIKEEVYIPIYSSKLVHDISIGDSIDEIKVHMIIEGMFYVLGADKNFKYNKIYKEILSSDDLYGKSIKKSIYESIKCGLIEDAFIYLNGLIVIEDTKENNEKLLIVLEELRKQNDIFIETEFEHIEKMKTEFPNYSLPYLYEGILRKDKLDFDGSMIALNEYIKLGGNKSTEVEEMIKEVQINRNYNKAKEIISDEPMEALKLLIPIAEDYHNRNQIYYDIALGYRLIKNHEKAIYYLNEILGMDGNVIEAISEMGINYACIGNYKEAITFFRKAFKVTKAIEICTNLIVCYINIGDLDQAKKHLEIAKKINPNDEILLKIDKMLS